MHRFGLILGLLLAVAGFAIAATVMLGFIGDSTSYPPTGAPLSQAPLAVVAGLALAAGLTLVGLNAGHWRQPVAPGPELDRKPDRQSENPLR
jgi:hypothetical protein